MPPEQKTEKALSPVEAAKFLRGLADKLEQGRMEFGDVLVELDADFTLKQSVKAKSDRLSFKIKLKYEKALPVLGRPAGGMHPLLERDDDDDEPEPPQSYKRLKKAMAKTFGQIGKALAGDALPAPALLQVFAAQSRQMVGFGGKGDEYYPAFLAETQALLAAAERGDAPQARLALAALNRRKKACHDRFK